MFALNPNTSAIRRARRVAATIAASVAILVGGLIVGAAPADAATIPAGSVLDQSNISATTTHTDQTFGQTFTAGVTGYLTAVGLGLSSNDSGAMSISIESTSGGLPTDTVLATGTFSGVDTSVIPLQSPLAIASGTQYAIVITGSIGFEYSQPDAYSGGNWVYTFPGAWTASPSIDMAFSTYVNSNVPTVGTINVSTPENTPLAIPLSAAGVGTITYASGANPSNGTLSVAGATATYTPTGNYVGPDSFSYIATNGNGPSVAGTVNVTVSAATVTLSVPQVKQGGSLTVSGAGFVAGSSVQIVLHSSPVVLATVVASPSGTFSQSVVIPSATVAGIHTLVADGGSVVATSGNLTVIPLLASTGVNVTPGLIGAGVLLATGMAALALSATRRRSLSYGLGNVPRSHQTQYFRLMCRRLLEKQ
jgi:hypothetical protein